MALVVLYVCTGNVCRSPIAELMLRNAAASDGDVEVSSAGLGALIGEEMDAGSAAALTEYGIDPAPHRARQFEPFMAARADLVLTAQRHHRDLVMTEVPTAFRRTFTMLEFARILHALDAEPTRQNRRSIIAAASNQRGVFGAVPLTADDIEDPYRRDLEFARVTAQRIMSSVRSTTLALALPPQPRRPVSPVARPRPRPSLPGPAQSRRPRPQRSTD